MERGDEVGLVLAGGGARGAYEAGVLSVLLPALEREGRLPTVIVGTSVGAVNAAYLAAALHLGADAATAGMVERWRSVRMSHVLRPLLAGQAVRTALAYAGELAGVPRVTLRALLDPAPLAETLGRWIDWRALHRNVRAGRLKALAVVATAAQRERSVVFVEGLRQDELFESYGVEYVSCRIDAQHVQASAAIPALFPAVRVDRPARRRGWYYDGGTRLNTPIKPALDMGVDRVAVVTTNSPNRRGGAEAEEKPDFAHGTVELVQATLVDPLIEDIRHLGKVNLLVRDGQPDSFTRWRERRGKAPYRVIPHLVVAPEGPRELGRAALEVMRRRYSGLRRLRSPDLSLMGRAVGGRSEPQGELLSYLFFEADFTERLIALGRRDAERALGAGPEVPWRIEPVGGPPHRDPP
jgi:NTE family protein